MAPEIRSLRVRCYAELNDGLPPERRQREFVEAVPQPPTVRRLLGLLGLPEREVELALVDGSSVAFDHPLQGGERIALFPVFESFDIKSLLAARERPLRQVRFVLDPELGRLAELLSGLGFDTIHDPGLTEAELGALSLRERRILLTRQPQLIARTGLSHGLFLQSERAEEQLHEVLERMDLAGNPRTPI